MKKPSPSGSGKKRTENKSDKPTSGRGYTGTPKRKFDGEARFRKTYGSSSDTEHTREKKNDAPFEKPKRRDHGGDKFAERKTGKKHVRNDKDRPESENRKVFKPRGQQPSTYNPDRRPEPRDGSAAPTHGRFNSDRYQRNYERPNREPRTFASKNQEQDAETRPEAWPMPLNKYIAHCGEASRRDAATLVKQGKVRVNGALILEPGHKIQATDKITLGGKKLTIRKNLVYVLLNKPKGFITTTDDPHGRKTVMSLVDSAADVRIFPVGRLDRNTTGLLLMTNDGDLAQKLSHPSHQVKKVYQVTLNKPFTKADFDKVLAGVKLEDGVAPVDSLAFLEEKNELGIEIHSGRNRIVRRIFESLGYDVVKLDRVMYAGLTKKNIPRGKWRFLTEREIVLLRHFKN